MPLDLENLIPQPNNWFSSAVEYIGHGLAEFSNPSVHLEGPTTVQFTDEGKPSIQMKLEKIPFKFDLNELFNVSSKLGAWKTYYRKRENSPCLRFEVQLPDGIFRLYGRIQYKYDEESGCLEFSVWGHSPRSQFDVVPPGRAKYWVIPLLNFVPELAIDLHHTYPHPLRIYPTPNVPADLSTEEHSEAVWMAHSQNGLISFQFNNQPGFIELLPDFRARQEALRNGEERAVTAVMVGEIGGESIEFEDVDRWFPFQFLSLLGLTIGTPVGSTGLEFRDAEGRLVRRIHASIGYAHFTKYARHQAIREILHHGTGELLTAFANFTADSKQERLYLGKAMGQLARCGLYSRDLDETLLNLCRSLDLLHEGHVREQILTIDSVRPHLQDAYDVVSQLQECAVRVVGQKRKKAQKDAAAEPLNEDKQSKAAALKRIEGYVANILNLRLGEGGEFGNKVLALLDKYSLPDAMIMEAHYRANPERYGHRTWASDLSRLRNTLAHGGTISIKNDHELEDAAWIMRHLHDISTRLILHILGYTGQYQPTVLEGNDPQNIDWVQHDFSAARLGYK